MRKLKIHLSAEGYCRKPDKKETGLISLKVTKDVTEIDIKSFAEDVGKHGKPFTPAVFNGGRKIENFYCQEVYALDFDGGITIDEFLEKAEEYGVLPAFIYATYSHTKENHRFRAVFINDCLVEDVRAASILLGLLLYLFPEADKCCKDVSRLFFGGKELIYLNETAQVNIKDIAISLQAKAAKTDSKNYGRAIQRIAKELDIQADKNLLCIHRLSELGENEENPAWTQYIIMGDALNSSKCYLIQTKHTTPGQYTG